VAAPTRFYNPMCCGTPCILGEAGARAPVRASPSMLSECLAPYGTSLAALTIVITNNAPQLCAVLFYNNCAVHNMALLFLIWQYKEE
jgi:hypothetical protein